MTSFEIFGFLNAVILFLFCLVIAVKVIGRVPMASSSIPGVLPAPTHVWVGLGLMLPSVILAGLFMWLVWYLDGELNFMTGLEVFSFVYAVVIGLYGLYLIP